MALASSGGYSADTGSDALPLGMMIEPLGRREPSFGRSSRDFLGRSCSDSEADEEAEEKGEIASIETGGLG